MRDNGLPAQEWTHVADLDPWVADAALAALRAAGVAAYATPHPGEAGPYLDVQLPSRPTDRLYVEAGARERAAAVLADLARSEAGGRDPRGADDADDVDDRSPLDVDATFAEIVSQFDTRTADAEPLSTSHEAPEPDEAPPSGRLIRGTFGWDDLLADSRPDPAVVVPPEDEDEGYVPPPPAPVPRGTPVRRFAWAAVLGAPLVVVLCVLLSYGLDGWTGLLVVATFVGGLVTLVVTLEDGPADDDGPDNGAVV